MSWYRLLKFAGIFIFALGILNIGLIIPAVIEALSTDNPIAAAMNILFFGLLLLLLGLLVFLLYFLDFHKRREARQLISKICPVCKTLSVRKELSLELFGLKEKVGYCCYNCDTVFEKRNEHFLISRLKKIMVQSKLCKKFSNMQNDMVCIYLSIKNFVEVVFFLVLLVLPIPILCWALWDIYHEAPSWGKPGQYSIEYLESRSENIKTPNAIYLSAEVRDMLNQKYFDETNEFQVCLIGIEYQDGILMNNWYEPNVANSSPYHILVDECNSLGTIHSHPGGTCEPSPIDVRNILNQKSVVGGIICGHNNFAFYSKHNNATAVKVYFVN